MDIINIKSFCFGKFVIRRLKRRAICWRKVFANHISKKRLVSRICKELSKLKKKKGTFLVVQWLGPCTFNAGGVSSIPGQGTEIPHATECGQKNQKEQIMDTYNSKYESQMSLISERRGSGASLVIQWMGIHLSMWGTQV